MEPLPLIPKGVTKFNYETAHILREAFQDLLGGQMLPQNISKNMEKYNITLDALKENAMNSNTVHGKYNAIEKDIKAVEQELMERQGEQFIIKDFITNNISVNEKVKLKRLRMIKELQSTHVHKYGLIKGDDLLPPLPERAIDFRINSNRHLCTVPCEVDLDVYPTKLSKIEKIPAIHKIHFNDTIIFEAIQKEILFSDYELNTTYLKRIKLRNVTNTTRSISLKVLPKTKYFTISLESNCRVAAGMCVIYTVKYNTDIYYDVEDEVIFYTREHNIVVNLRSQRMSPCLRIFIFRTKSFISRALKLDSLSDEFFDIDRTMALNTSIDCGSTLIGDEVILSIVIKNEGNCGKFFFITESDWFCSNIQHISNNIELIAGAFRLYPAYFQIKESEFAEIVLSFFPKRYGLFVETIYLLCNNNMYEELDFMGDGVYFEKTFITFDLKKKQSKPFFLDYKSDYCLHLGKCLSCTKHDGFIRVTNNSPLNLCYRWVIRYSENPNATDFKHMPPFWITIKRITSLPPHCTTDFDMTILPETMTSGLYRIVLSLYIENIPEISLRDLEEFTVVEKSDEENDKKLLDVLVGEVELLCEVETINIVIEPNPLIIPLNLPLHVDYKQTIIIKPNSHFQQNCEWIPHKNNKKIRIEPEEFELFAEDFKCTVFVNKTDGMDIVEEFLLYVNGGIHKIYFKVIAKLMISRASLSVAVIDFSNVMLNFIYNKTFQVENNSKEIIQWRINEDVIDVQTDKVLTVQGPKKLIPNFGTLDGGQSCAVQYTANTQKCGEWLSYLKLYTNFSENDKSDFVCAIRYKVSKPEILIHTNTSELPIICPEEMLYVGVSISGKICLHNCGNIPLIFICGKPTGVSSSDFDITITPNIGIVDMYKNCQIDVIVTPKTVGYFEDAYVPVFTLGLENPTLIKLMCLVGDIAVDILWPDGQENYVAIPWPKLYTEVRQEICADEYDTFYKSQNEITHGIFENGSIQELLAKEVITDSQETLARNSLSTQLEYVDNEPIENVVENLYQSEIFSFSSTNKTSVTNFTSTSFVHTVDDYTSTRSTNQSQDKKSLKLVMEEQFESELNLQDFILEFKKVPLRTPIKKTVKVKNITPASGLLSVEITNFYQTKESKDTLRDILVELNMTASTKWEDLVTSDGIVIKTDNPKKVISAYETVDFDIWVYSNTWGYYVDEIVIDIGQAFPFCASILVEVIGLPIEFPIAQNSICEEPTVRLGIMSCNLENFKRRLKVVNTSMIPVYISWHLLVNLSKSPREFSLIFDMPNSEMQQFFEKVRGEIILTEQYFGELNTKYFKIQPLTSYIPAGSFTYVEITTNVINFDEKHVRKKIEANLLGVIRLSTEFRSFSNLFVRPTGKNLDLTKMKFTLEVDFPELLLDDRPEKIMIIAYATDVMETRLFSHEKKLIFRNANDCPAMVYLEIEKPFSVARVQTPKFCASQYSSSLLLDPGECMEVIIECILTKEDIHNLIETLRSESKDSIAEFPNFEDNSLTICKTLSVYEGYYLRKLISLHLKIFYPIFKVIPGNVKFGIVYVGNTANITVTLKNLTAVPIKYEVYKCNKIKEIVVRPKLGIIPKATDGGICALNIFFTPIEHKTYEEWIAVTTTIAHHYVTINVMGMGTYDEKFYSPGLN